MRYWARQPSDQWCRVSSMQVHGLGMVGATLVSVSVSSSRHMPGPRRPGPGQPHPFLGNAAAPHPACACAAFPPKRQGLLGALPAALVGIGQELLSGSRYQDCASRAQFLPCSTSHEICPRQKQGIRDLASVQIQAMPGCHGMQSFRMLVAQAGLVAVDASSKVQSFTQLDGAVSS